MGRKKRGGPPGRAPEGPPPVTPERQAGGEEEPKAKYSVLIPASLDARVHAVLQAKGISLSFLMRKLLEEGLEELEGGAAPMRGALSLQLAGPVRRLLAEVASLWGVPPDNMAAIVLGESLPQFHERGLKNRAAVEKALGAAKAGGGKHQNNNDDHTP